MPERVRITDVSPRDGLQNEPGVIPTLDKALLVKQLVGTGVDEIEVTSFVSPKWVPQLGDARTLLIEAADTKDDSVRFSALVPNIKGMEAAAEAMAAAASELRGKNLCKALDKVAVFTAASETFSLRNTNAGIRQSIDRFGPVVALARRNDLLVRGYVSCAIACPFEGPIQPEAVANVVSMLFDVGVDEIDLGDTIGAGAAESIHSLLATLIDRFGAERFGPTSPGECGITLHLHDTFGRAAGCVKAALDMGVRSFDGSVAGLGGCPYASKTLPDGTIQRAPGNISTELLVRTVHEAGYETGVDLDALARAAAFARSIVSRSREETSRGGAEHAGETEKP